MKDQKPPSDNPPQPIIKINNFPILGFAIVILIIAAIPSVYFFNQYQKTAKLLQGSPLANQKAVTDLVTQVGKLIELPKNEVPTVATVSDITKLKSQAFFKNAKNGDKVLIYTKAKEAILYRPSTNKIIEVGPITVSLSPSPQVTSAVQQIKAVVYNGTNTIGLGGTVEKEITDKNANIDVTDVANAKKNTYSTTLVVDLTGKNSALVSQLATQLGGQVGSLPDGEVKPTADILVIAGK